MTIGIRPGMVIALVGGRNHKYCSAKKKGMACKRNHIGSREKFVVINVGSGKISLKSGAGDGICGADDRGIIMCDRAEIGEMETFEVAGETTITLKGGKLNKYCSDTTNYLTSWVECTKESARGWEQFQVICLEYCDGVLGAATTGAFVTDDVDAGKVDFLFTVGGMGAMTFTAENKRDPSGCFDGIRFYREHYTLGVKNTDLAAIIGPFSHFKTNLLLVGKNGVSDSSYWPCPGKPMWPRWWGSFPNILLHFGTSGKAKKILADVESGKALSGVTDVDGFAPLLKRGVVGAVIADSTIANVTSWGTATVSDFHKVLENTKKLGPNYRLIGVQAVKDPYMIADLDWTTVTQDTSTLDCFLTFEATDPNPIEQAKNLLMIPKDFCGCTSCAHMEWVNALRNMVHHPQYLTNIKPKLQKCNKVSVTGWSLGGCLGDLFTWCVNSGSGEDHQLMVWKKETPELMPEATAADVVAPFSN